MTNEEYDALLSDTDKNIDRLHALYEQWFQGIERREPAKLREQVQRRVDALRTQMPRNTGLRFRAQNLFARWVTMTHHWTKVSRQIEEGTYKRDVLRAKRKLAEREERERRMGQRKKSADAPAPDASAPPEGLGGWQLDDESLDDAFDKLLDVPLPGFGDEGAAAVIAPPMRAPAPASTGAAPRPLPPPPSAPAMVRPPPPPPPPLARPPAPPSAPAAPRVQAHQAASGPDYQTIYSRYVDARKQNNERVDNVRMETIVATLEKQIPELRKKHGDKAIDFEVVVRDGRVGLKPVVR